MVLNSLDNFLDEDEDGGSEGKELNKNVVSTEGCFACDLNKVSKGQQQPVQLTRQGSVTQSRRHSQPQNGRRRRHHHGSRHRRHLEKPAMFGMSKVYSAMNPLYATNDTSRIVTDHVKSDAATRLTVKLTRDRTKLQRPILFLQPALTDELMTSQHVYSLKGKDKLLFGLRRASDGVWALFYQVKCS